MIDIKAVIFDVDGVLFDTETMSVKYWTDTMKKHGYTMTKEIYSEAMGRNRQGVIDKLKEIYNDPSIDFETISDEKTAAMTARLDSEPIPLLPGVFEIIDYLEKRGFRLGIATSTRRIKAEPRLKREGIYSHFSAFSYGCEVKNSKPDPEIFLNVAQRLGVKPEETIVIEDSPSGVKAAYRGNFRCINVVGVKKPTDEVKKETIAICDSLFEVIDYFEKNVRHI